MKEKGRALLKKKKRILSLLLTLLCVCLLCGGALIASAEEATMETVIHDKVDWLNTNILWGIPMIALLVGAGIYLTIGTGFFQVRRFGHTLKQTLFAIFKDREVTKTKDTKNISQFQSLCTALAATVGTGNIVGVATAISMGGAGAVFWMWVSAFFGMMTNYSENVLGIYYRRKNKKGEWMGGAMYYIESGLKCKWLAVIFALCCLLASLGIGNITQVNGIATSMQKTFDLPSLFTSLFGQAETNYNISGIVVGIIIAALVAVVVIGGIKRIAAVTEKLVPFMALFYIVGALVVILVNAEHIPTAFGAIFTGAFSLESVSGGIMGYVIAQAIRYGVARGVFSNEAGLGSSVMVHSNSNVKEPVTQGLWGIFEVFFDTIIICTMTALTILTTGADQQGLEGVQITQYAFSSVLTFGGFDLGGLIVTFSILLFAFSTILGWSLYGTRAIQYLGGDKAVPYYKAFFCIILIFGAVSKVQLVWDLADTFNALMAIPNLIGVVALSGTVFAITRNYSDRRFHHKDEKPMRSAFAEYNDDLAPTDE